ncbi:MAG: T9SS type A sorting domain-containing protein [Flavobacteriales bacterium]
MERYYVSDSADAADTLGGNLLEGSVTYRVYALLDSGYQIIELFGDSSRPFHIESTENFYNHPNAPSFGTDLLKISYEDDTYALDSYITIGQNGKQASKLYFGVPKILDNDSLSFIGGANNYPGLLINQDSTAGIPLTIADGMDTLNQNITDWFDFGLEDFLTGIDSTSIFTHLKDTNSFGGENFVLRNSGVVGVYPSHNYVLISQLTTHGELSFTMNLKLYNPLTGDTVKYIGTNIPQGDEEFSPLLSYPLICGCLDPEFVEYTPEFACEDASACLTPVVIGCTDTLACNYDAEANTPDLYNCCYPGFCNERDIEQVCPHLKGASFDVSIFPNPATDVITLSAVSGVASNLEYWIYNYSGVLISQELIVNAPLNYSKTISLAGYENGIYQMKVSGISGMENKLFVKL